MSITSFDDNLDDYTEVLSSVDNIGRTAVDELNVYRRQSNCELLDKFSVMLNYCMHGIHGEQDKIVYCTRGPRVDWIRDGDDEEFRFPGSVDRLTG